MFFTAARHLTNRLLATAILLSVGVGVQADEIRLHNGDKLTGRIVAEDATTITFASPLLGEFKVAKKDAEITRSPLTVDASAPKPTATKADGPELTAKTPHARPDKPVATAKASWKRKLELGFRQNRGAHDLTSIDLRASGERKTKANAFVADARLLYGEQDDKVNNDRYDASFRWRHELGNRTFAQTLSTYYRDDLKRIPANVEQNIGFGYKLFDAHEQVINLGAGVTGQYRDSEVDQNGFFTLFEVFQDYTYQISSRMKFSQNSVAQYSPNSRTRFQSVPSQPSSLNDGEANYKLRFNTALQGQLTNSISLNLRFEYEFDNAISSANARGDQRLTSSIGYGF